MNCVSFIIKHDALCVGIVRMRMRRVHDHDGETALLQHAREGAAARPNRQGARRIVPADRDAGAGALLVVEGQAVVLVKREIRIRAGVDVQADCISGPNGRMEPARTKSGIRS